MYSHIAETWKTMLKTRSPEIKNKAYVWRREPTIHKIEHPTRIDRARALGYKAKQGIIVIRARVGRGGMRKQRPVAGRRPKHSGVIRIKQATNMRLVAERRVNEKYPNMEIIGSYFLYKDGKHSWYEVILADPSHPSIYKDKEMRGKLKSLT